MGYKTGYSSGDLAQRHYHKIEPYIQRGIKEGLESNIPIPSFNPKKEGKLSGIESLNTHPLLNPYCIDRCPMRDQCYAKKSLLTYRQNCNRNYARNYQVLQRDLKVLPVFFGRYVRFNAFGELIDKTHLYNLVKIAQFYSDITFSLFTHRVDDCEKWFDGMQIPDNLVIVYSNQEINRIIDPKDYKYATNTYNVISEDNTVNTPTCAGRCISCLKCFTKGNAVIGRKY